jgi:hypothetical protein
MTTTMPLQRIGHSAWDYAYFCLGMCNECCNEAPDPKQDTALKSPLDFNAVSDPNGKKCYDEAPDPKNMPSLRRTVSQEACSTLA